MTFTSAEIAVLSQAGLEALRNKNGLLTKISRNFSTATGTSVLVPYMNADSASQWATATGYGPETGTITGISITMAEPYKKSYELTPLQNGAYNFDYVATVAFPTQIACVVQECYKQIYKLVDATTFPVQQSGSAVATYDQVESGSQVVFTSGSSAAQYCLVSQKYDKQLKSNLVAANYLVGAQVINGQARSEYICGNVDVIPAYDLTSVSTGADAVVLIPDSILAASRLPQVNPDAQVFDIVDPASGLAIRSFVWNHPVNHTPMLTSTVQFSTARGRVGFGARLKIN
jgi:hypothetical protein